MNTRGKSKDRHLNADAEIFSLSSKMGLYGVNGDYSLARVTAIVSIEL